MYTRLNKVSDELSVLALTVFSIAAKIGEDILPSLSREEIKDLFPGPENFHRRRAIWLVVNKDEKVSSIICTLSLDMIKCSGVHP